MEDRKSMRYRVAKEYESSVCLATPLTRARKSISYIMLQTIMASLLSFMSHTNTRDVFTPIEFRNRAKMMMRKIKIY